jgi:5-methyltetrahydrofolate--homocysteine methyltransferase
MRLRNCWASDRINLRMDESEQLYPEQSTTALSEAVPKGIVAYHPVARYFSA